MKERRSVFLYTVQGYASFYMRRGTREPLIHSSFVIRLIMAVIALVTAFVPGQIVSLCMMSSMRCVSVMRPAAILIAGLITVFSAVDIALCMKRQ